MAAVEDATVGGLGDGAGMLMAPLSLLRVTGRVATRPCLITSPTPKLVRPLGLSGWRAEVADGRRVSTGPGRSTTSGPVGAHPSRVPWQDWTGAW